jgi:hypothetical protein
MDIDLGFEGLSPQIDFLPWAEVLEAQFPLRALALGVLLWVMDIDLGFEGLSPRMNLSGG